MSRYSASIDFVLLRSLADEVAAAADQGCRAIQCEGMVVVDFLSALRFRHHLSTGVLRVSYRSPAGFWLDCPKEVAPSLTQPLSWLWTHYWLAHRRPELAQRAVGLSALQFAQLCERYSKVLHKQLPKRLLRRMEQQLTEALRGLTDEVGHALPSSPSRSIASSAVERRSFAAMLQTIAEDAQAQLNLSL